MDLAYCIFWQTKFRPVYTSSMNIWASRRMPKSKRIPRQRNDFTQGQNLNVWTEKLDFFYLMGHGRESSQGRLLWTVYHHGIRFFAGGNTHAVLFPSDFLLPSAWSVQTQVAGRRQCLPQMLLQTRCKLRKLQPVFHFWFLTISSPTGQPAGWRP